LGNLALTYDNSAYSNKCFEEKKGAARSLDDGRVTCYAQGRLHQERELALYEAWTPQTVRDRQQRLAEWALSHWAVERPGDEEVDDEPEMEPDGTIEDEESLAMRVPPGANWPVSYP